VLALGFEVDEFADFRIVQGELAHRFRGAKKGEMDEGSVQLFLDCRSLVVNVNRNEKSFAATGKKSGRGALTEARRHREKSERVLVFV
jgi:hypothetical protein